MINSTIEFMHNNLEVIFTRADKSSVTVALNKNVYVQKIEKLIARHILEKIFDTRELSSEDMRWGSLFKIDLWR